jgi:hypothetical protein
VFVRLYDGSNGALLGEVVPPSPAPGSWSAYALTDLIAWNGSLLLSGRRAGVLPPSCLWTIELGQTRPLGPVAVHSVDSSRFVEALAVAPARSSPPAIYVAGSRVPRRGPVTQWLARLEAPGGEFVWESQRATGEVVALSSTNSPTRAAVYVASVDPRPLGGSTATVCKVVE